MNDAPGADAFLRQFARQGKRKGRICSFLSWKERPLEPILVLYAHPTVTGRGFAITKSRIGRYVTLPEGLPTVALTVKAREVAMNMGLDTTEMTLNAIIDVVIAQAAELTAMPDFPPGIKVVH